MPKYEGRLDKKATQVKLETQTKWSDPINAGFFLVKIQVWS